MKNVHLILLVLVVTIFFGGACGAVNQSEIGNADDDAANTKKNKKYKNSHQSNSQKAENESSSSSRLHHNFSCGSKLKKLSSILERHRRRRRNSKHKKSYLRHPNPKLAYKMAILSSLSYWEFHKWMLPESCTGFRLLQQPQSSMLSKFRCLLSTDTLFRSNIANLASTKTMSNRKDNQDKHPDDTTMSFQYWLYNWYEPSPVAGVNFHDTDVLVSTSSKNSNSFFPSRDDALIVSFAGTASAADAVTNLQTFEPANHSSFFMDSSDKNESLKGSIHRGFLNAYSRVKLGSVLRLQKTQQNDNNTPTSNGKSLLLGTLHQRFSQCSGDSTSSSPPPLSTEKGNVKEHPRKKKKKNSDSGSNPPYKVFHESTVIVRNKNKDGKKEQYDVVALKEEQSNDDLMNNQLPPLSIDDYNNIKTKRRRNGKGGCQVKGIGLVNILRETVIDALHAGQTVHITGHSLGGGLATLLAMDIIINFPDVPIGKLYLWTFGAPQVADDIFLQSAINAAGPRLERFLKGRGHSLIRQQLLGLLGGGGGRRGDRPTGSRFHRFVTLSDNCEVDAVSEVTKRALASHKTNLHGHSARTLGGVHGHVVHFTSDPYYLLIPTSTNINNDDDHCCLLLENDEDVDSNYKDTTSNDAPSRRRRSAVAAHATANYLLGISKESENHPLRTDLPLELSKWLHEPSSL